MLLKSRKSLAAFLELPEQQPAREYHRGEVRQKKVAKQIEHAWVALAIMNRVNAPTMPERLGVAVAEHRGAFGEMSSVREVSVDRWSQLPRDPRGRGMGRVRTAPIIVTDDHATGPAPTAGA